MASAGLLALLDDIATLLDDIALLTKATAKKTAGVLGDDLALNAQQVSGVQANRELPVVWAVAKGSARNKAILVPAALLLSLFLPMLITPLLLLGGAFLCYEGVEKVIEKLFHKQPSHHATEQPPTDLQQFEQEKIQGAIRTDFILSAEIVVIALGIVQEASMTQQIMVLIVVAIAMTVGVYGLVAAIVKLDDLGLYCLQKTQPFLQWLGRGILLACPVLMKLLAIAGTIAMFLVGGGIVVHSIPTLHHWLEGFSSLLVQQPALAGLAASLASAVFNALVGIMTGAVVVALVSSYQHWRKAT